MATATVYECRCSTCGYFMEFLDKPKTKRAVRYHQYKKPSHDVELSSDAGAMRGSTYIKIKDWTNRDDYEFEENYRVWMAPLAIFYNILR